MSEGKREFSIWFIIGVMLLIYGALILGAAVWELFSPPQRPVVLAELRAGIWWGVLTLALGGVYTYFCAPGRNRG